MLPFDAVNDRRRDRARSTQPRARARQGEIMTRPIVTVLRCDDVPEPDRTRHGDTHERMLRHLKRAAADAGLDLTFRTVDAFGGDLPTDDDPSALFVTTGSATDPDSTEPWVLALNAWLKSTIERRRPVYGICFGHQVLAHALGGTTSRHPNGWEVGLVPMRQRFALPIGGASQPDALHVPEPEQEANVDLPTELDAAFEGTDDAAAPIQLLMSHQDIVVTRPAGAIPWMVGDFCKEQGYVIPGLAVTLQGHPEFEAEQVADIYRRRRDRLGDAMADAAIESSKARNDGLSVTTEVLRYFLG